MWIHHRDALAADALDPYLAAGTLDERLPAMLEAWFSYVEHHPHACRMLLRDAGDSETRELYEDLHARQRAADAAILRETLPHLTEAQNRAARRGRAQRTRGARTVVARPSRGRARRRRRDDA
jgi:hypothetical protein